MIDIHIGARFGRYTVTNTAPKDLYGKKQWFCRCDCGEHRLVREYRLVTGESQSCGCWGLEKMLQAAEAKNHARQDEPTVPTPRIDPLER